MRNNAWKVCVASGLLSASLLLGVHSVIAGNAGIVKLPRDITFKATAAGVQLWV
jgi:hypothetical protein